MELKTDRLILREFRKSDLDLLRKNISTIRVSCWLSVVPYPYTAKNANEFLSLCTKSAKKKPRTDYRLVVADRSSDELMGGIGLHHIDDFSGTATIGYWLGEKYWGKGLMTEAFTKLLEFAFNKRKLRRIDISVYDGNLGSQRLIEKMGFSYEGKRIQRIRCKAGKKLHDEKIYGLLREDWLKKQKINV